MRNICNQVEDVSCVTTYSGEVISMCVVPIKIRYQNTGKEPSIYAVLDSCNQGVFIRKALPKLLEHQDMKHSRNQTHSSLAVENLEIASNGSCNKQWIKLPKSYARASN